MSLDAHLFLRSSDFYGSAFQRLLTVDGVTLAPERQLRIDGLTEVNCSELDERHCEIMRDDFGAYGLDVNWLVTGTHDRDADIIDLMDRLYRCAAAIICAYPNQSLSLMNTAHQRFHVYNTESELILSPMYWGDVSATPEIFGKPYVIKDIEVARITDSWSVD